tara:strand:- start:1011 stop:1196 length:186 start_codon:yes stop_codon:yes gene_type:complete
MAVVVKVIRDDNPKNDAVGTSTYAAAVDAAIDSTTAALTKVTSAWDPRTGSLVTTICIFDA